GLPKVETRDERRRAHAALLPNVGSPSGATSAESAAMTSSLGYNWSAVSTNWHANSEANHSGPRARRSSSRNAGLIRGQADAGISHRAQEGPPLAHASYHQPRLPQGVLIVTRRPPLTASIGRTAAIISSGTRLASSTRRSATLAKPRTVSSLPGKA